MKKRRVVNSYFVIETSYVWQDLAPQGDIPLGEQQHFCPAAEMERSQ